MKAALLMQIAILGISSVYGADDAIVRPVQETFVGENFLRVMDLLQMGPEFKGRSIAYLLLRGRSENGKGQVAAYINGKDVTSFQTLGELESTYTFPIPSSANQIGENVGDIQLHLRGMVTVEAVGIKLVPGVVPPPGPTNPNPPSPPSPPFPPERPVQPDPVQPTPPAPPAPPPAPPSPPVPEDRSTVLRFPLQQYILRSQVLSFSSFVDLRKISNLRLKKVTLHAQSRYGRGRVTYCGNFGCTKREIGEELAAYTFNGHNELARTAGSVWRFGMSGEFYVDRIELEFVR